MKSSAAAIARLTVAIAVVLTTAAAPARAEDKAEARRRFAAGVERAEAGAYEQAMAEFRRAYDASPNYAVLYNIAEMQRALGDAVGALETFQRYLTDGGAAVPAARRAKVTAAMNAERAKTGSLVINVTRPPPPHAPVRVLVDDRVVDVDLDVATVGPLRMNAGHHKVVAVAEGSPTAERDIVVAPGETATVALTLGAAPLSARAEAPPPILTPTPTPQPSLAAAPPPASAPAAAVTAPAARPPEASTVATPRPARAELRRTLGYAAVGAGAGGLAIAAVSYYLARSRLQQAVDDGCTRALCTGQAASEYDSARRAITVVNVSAIAGGVLLAGGALLIVSGRW